jgi:hypothetical protein
MAPRAGTAEPITTVASEVRREWVDKQKTSRTCKSPVNRDDDGPKDTSLSRHEGRAFEHVLDD